MSTVISLKIPKNIASAARLPQKNIEKELKKELALQLYAIGALSFGKARELAETGVWEFHFLLGERKIPRNYNIEAYEEDLKTIR